MVTFEVFEFWGNTIQPITTTTLRNYLQRNCMELKQPHVIAATKPHRRGALVSAGMVFL